MEKPEAENEIKDPEEVTRILKDLFSDGEIVEMARKESFSLVLSTFNRPGPSYSCKEDYRVLLGKIASVEIACHYSYPCENSHEFMIIPLEVPTVIHHWKKGDKELLSNDVDVIWVFRGKSGWSEVRCKKDDS